MMCRALRCNIFAYCLSRPAERVEFCRLEINIHVSVRGFRLLIEKAKFSHTYLKKREDEGPQCRDISCGSSAVHGCCRVMQSRLRDVARAQTIRSLQLKICLFLCPDGSVVSFYHDLRTSFILAKLSITQV